MEIKNIGYYQFVNNIPDGFEKGDESFVIELGKVINYFIEFDKSFPGEPEIFEVIRNG